MLQYSFVSYFSLLVKLFSKSMLLGHLFKRPVIMLRYKSVFREREQNAATPILYKIGVADVLDFIGRGEWI